MIRAQLVSTPHSEPSSLAARGGRIAASVWRRFWNWRARQATIQILDALDDRTLHDIGISRGEIISAVYGRHGDRRRAYHLDWRCHT